MPGFETTGSRRVHVSLVINIDLHIAGGRLHLEIAVIAPEHGQGGEQREGKYKQKTAHVISGVGRRTLSPTG
jgi:hypothetical protein